MSIQRLDLPSLRSLLLEHPAVPDHILVRNIVVDHRHIKAGDLFIARSGVHHKGADYVVPAIQAGASAVLMAKSDYHQGLQDYADLIFPVENLTQVMGEVIHRYYESVTEQMAVIGVTGTNGKTSCCHFIAQALNLLGEKTAYIGTIGFGFPGQLEEATHTTPEVLRLHQLLARYKSEGAKAVVMEVSSHALDQGRTSGVMFSQVGFTNLTRDHLDYHQTMEAYAASKQRLFENTSAVQLLNIDDDFGVKLAAKASEQELPVLTYSLIKSNADIFVRHSEFNIEGIGFVLSTPWGEVATQSKLIGRFNLSNLLLTTASLGAAGYPVTQIGKVLSKIEPVSGRMGKVSQDNEPLVLVDYAHTPDALLQTLSALNEHRKEGGKVICVFGCGGDRDQGKRPIMAQIASGLADKLVITSDNPRTENPMFIINQILSGLTDQSKAVVESDRAEAISQAISIASNVDIVLIAGKGHEDYQEIDGHRYPFSDQQVARAHLDKRAFR